ncbi:LytTR family DNA-binding domain-containing protein [Alteromonas sp. ASW11-36]|uniref:LytTR family DNA-binding domain-containing protein n=1 Tax=Alteromonas arenosi TaxID=3055817 RepID=A0ABT7SS64_9ALTE|nr:LytTR family DNA-binding domain-containing protein [Alteromonas sp. ASW11-36]MDM7859029.1 LytTR family DNA-binding domain-containing protein [Alteromonas sp. ASW11-36]
MKTAQNSGVDGVQGQAVDSRDENSPRLQRWLKKITAAPNRFLLLALLIYMVINNTINATSVWMEITRDGQPEFALWELFVWEYSSLLANFLLLPLIFWVWQRYPLRFSYPYRQLLMHAGVSLLYAIGHVSLMVAMREGVYSLAGGNYDFGPVLREFFYEYRKDVWGYVFFLLVFNIYHRVLSRIAGEANIIANSEAEEVTAPSALPEHLLVKKLDKEFLVKINEVDWLEASGNYVNLYVGERIYPLRSTLSQLTTKLNSQFTRIHRSHAVNHKAIEHIQYSSSGDGEVTLKSGVTLPVSRRYKDQLKHKLSV